MSQSVAFHAQQIASLSLSLARSLPLWLSGESGTTYSDCPCPDALYHIRTPHGKAQYKLVFKPKMHTCHGTALRDCHAARQRGVAVLVLRLELGQHVVWDVPFWECLMCRCCCNLVITPEDVPHLKFTCREKLQVLGNNCLGKRMSQYWKMWTQPLAVWQASRAAGCAAVARPSQRLVVRDSSPHTAARRCCQRSTLAHRCEYCQASRALIHLCGRTEARVPRRPGLSHLNLEG
jgi:hypothetical protein